MTPSLERRRLDRTYLEESQHQFWNLLETQPLTPEVVSTLEATQQKIRQTLGHPDKKGLHDELALHLLMKGAPTTAAKSLNSLQHQSPLFQGMLENLDHAPWKKLVEETAEEIFKVIGKPMPPEDIESMSGKVSKIPPLSLTPENTEEQEMIQLLGGDDPNLIRAASQAFNRSSRQDRPEAPLRPSEDLLSYLQLLKRTLEEQQKMIEGLQAGPEVISQSETMRRTSLAFIAAIEQQLEGFRFPKSVLRQLLSVIATGDQISDMIQDPEIRQQLSRKDSDARLQSTLQQALRQMIGGVELIDGFVQIAQALSQRSHAMMTVQRLSEVETRAQQLAKENQQLRHQLAELRQQVEDSKAVLEEQSQFFSVTQERVERAGTMEAARLQDEHSREMAPLRGLLSQSEAALPILIKLIGNGKSPTASGVTRLFSRGLSDDEKRALAELVDAISVAKESRKK